MTWPQARMYLEQGQSDQDSVGERKLSAKDQESNGERKLSARGVEIQQFSGKDASSQYDAWNQRRQLRGKL